MKAWGKNNLHILVPLIIAIVLRLIHFVFVAYTDPLFRIPVCDEWFHANQARQIVENSWLLKGNGAYYKGPLFSYVLAFLFWIFGKSSGIIAGRLLNLALGCLSVFFVARIAERLGGKGAAWASGLAAAVYGTAIYFDTTLLLIPLATVLLLAATERLIVANDTDSPAVALIFAGLLLGLLSINRPNAILLIGTAALWAAASAHKKIWPNITSIRAFLLIVIASAIVIVPVTIRNVVVEKDPVIISYHGGFNLFESNDPAFEQSGGTWSGDLAWARIYYTPFELSPANGINLGPVRGSFHQRFYLKQFYRVIKNYPLRTLKIIASKIPLLVSNYEIQNNRRIGEAKERSPLLAVLMAENEHFALPLSIVAPLLAVGLLMAFASKTRGRYLVILLALTWYITPILFFNTARFRLPGVFLLMPLAAAGWMRIGVLCKSRPSICKAAALLLITTIIIGSVTIPKNPPMPPSDTLYLGDVAWRENRLVDSLRWRRTAMEEEPDNPMVRIRLADVLRRLGRYEESLEHYRFVYSNDAFDGDWRNAALRSNARSLFMLGKYSESIAYFNRYIDADPDRPYSGERPDYHLYDVPPLQACIIRLELSDAYKMNGQLDKARDELDKVINDCKEGERLVNSAKLKTLLLYYPINRS